MSKNERDHLIEWLAIITGYNREYFTKQSDEHLEWMYEKNMSESQLENM